MSRQIVYRLIYIPSLIGIVALVFLFASSSRPHTSFAPDSMKTFAAEDKSFRIDYPKSWEAKVATMNGTGTRAHFHRDEESEVVVSCDLTNSLMVDIARATSANQSGANQPSGSTASGTEGAAPSGLPAGMDAILKSAGSAGSQTPLQAAHNAGTAYMKSKFRHFEASKAVPFRLAGGDALTSDFTAKTTDFFNPKEIVGRHITVLTGNRPIDIDAYSPKGDEGDLYKALDAMLKTLRITETGG